MTGSCRHESCTQCHAYGVEKLLNKIWTVIRQRTVGYAIRQDPVFHKNSCHICHCRSASWNSHFNFEKWPVTTTMKLFSVFIFGRGQECPSRQIAMVSLEGTASRGVDALDIVDVVYRTGISPRNYRSHSLYAARNNTVS